MQLLMFSTPPKPVRSQSDLPVTHFVSVGAPERTSEAAAALPASLPDDDTTNRAVAAADKDVTRNGWNRGCTCRMSAVKQRFCQNYFHFIARPLAQSMWVGACKHHKWTSLQLALRVWTVDMDMDGFKKEEEGGTKKCQCFAGTTRPPPLMPDAVSGPHTKKG